jgi:hypothetical protein
MYHKETRADNVKWVELDGNKVIAQPHRCSHIVSSHDLFAMLVAVQSAEINLEEVMYYVRIPTM